MSVFQQFFGSATAIVNQTNAGSNSLVSQIGSGGSNTPSVSSFNTASITALTVSSIVSPNPGSADVSFVGLTGDIALDQNSSGQGIQFNNGTYAEIRNTGSLLRLGGQIGQTEIPVSMSSLMVSSINGQSPGGGGPIGPNPSVSTLTFSAGALNTGNTNGTINMSAVLNILDPAVSTPQNNHFQFATKLNPQAGFPSYIPQYQSTFNNFSLWGPSSNMTTTGSFSFSSDILGRSQIVASCSSGALSTLVLSADSVLVPTGMNISSLTVSSINGAAPGGGSAISTFNQLFTSTIQCLNPVAQNLIITGNSNNLVVDLETPLVSRLRFTPSTSIGNGGGQGPFIKVQDQGNANYTLSIESDAAPALITSISSLTVSSINNAAYLLSGTATNFVNTLGSGIATSNSMIYTNGKFQVIQFDVNVSTILNGGASPTAFFIPMIQSQITPGNWKWAQGFTPNVSMCGLAGSENYVGGVQTVNLQMAGDPATNNQTLQVWGSFTDSNYQPNYRITLTGIAP